MRKITKIKYEIIKESDINQEMIYVFQDGKDFVFLCRKNNMFFWKCLCSVNYVWYDEYKTIENAIQEVTKVREYKERHCGPIIEFNRTSEFIEYAYERICKTEQSTNNFLRQ